MQTLPKRLAIKKSAILLLTTSLILKIEISDSVLTSYSIDTVNSSFFEKYNMKMKKALKLVLLSILMLHISFKLIDIQKEKIFEEKKGIVAVEAEHYASQKETTVRKWYLQNTTSAVDIKPDADSNHAENASNQAYLEILPDTRVTHDDKLVHGESFSNQPGVMAILDYNVYFNTPGKYYVWVRTHTSGTEDNGIHVGIDGTWPESGQRMQFAGKKEQWSWESKQRTEDVHTGVEKLIFLEIEEIGLHTISFSMREDGFEFDKWAMTLKYKAPKGFGPKERLKKEN